MVIKEINPDKIFQGYNEGKHYVCVDFMKKEYIDCDTITVTQLYDLVKRIDTVKFYRVEAGE